MSDKHTPGHWKYFTRLSGSENHKGFRIFQKEEDHEFWVADVSPLDEDGIDGEKYARLIAAAPDIFKALDELMQAHDEDIGMDGYPDDESIGFQGDGQDMLMTFGMLRRARAALKKARGEE